MARNRGITHGVGTLGVAKPHKFLGMFFVLFLLFHCLLTLSINKINLKRQMSAIHPLPSSVHIRSYHHNYGLTQSKD